MSDEAIEVRRFLYEVENGAYDLPPMQRPLYVRPKFSVQLIDSLYRGYRVGSMLIWEPPVGERPRAGRYQAGQPRPRGWILDGQQRGTSYAAAFGRRPSWLSEQQWTAANGEGLEVALAFTKTGEIRFCPYLTGQGNRVRLSDLITEESNDVRRALVAAGYRPTDKLMDKAMNARNVLMNYQLPVERLSAGWSDAVENFIRRNPSLSSEDRWLCSMSIAMEELQREHVDALVGKASETGFGAMIDRRRINLILRSFLPPRARLDHGRRAEREAVSGAMERTTKAVTQVIEFLHGQGITTDGLLWSASVVQVLCALFDRFPQAATAPLTWRWLVHAAAGDFYPGGRLSSRARLDVQRVVEAESFEDAVSSLARHGAPGALRRLEPTDWVRAKPRGNSLGLGAAGTLYAMACAHQASGPVVDFAESGMVFPDRRMRPNLLWPNTEVQGSLAAWALLGPESARQVSEAGGWGRRVFEELDVPPGRLAAHHLEVPVSGPTRRPVEQQVKMRVEEMVATVNSFLDSVGPLPATDSEA